MGRCCNHVDGDLVRAKRLHQRTTTLLLFSRPVAIKHDWVERIDQHLPSPSCDAKKKEPLASAGVERFA